MKIRISRFAVAGVAALAVVCGISAASIGASPNDATQQGSVRRLTEAQYRRTVADVFGPDIQIAGRFPTDLRMNGLIAVGAGAVAMTPGAIEQYDELARGVAEQVTDPGHRGSLIGCGRSDDDPQGLSCANSVLARYGERLFRRPVRPEELRSYTNAALLGAQKLGDFHAGLAASLAGMLDSPNFLYRIDRQLPGSGTVDGFSKATRLSFLLWNSVPDDVLLEAAGRGELDTPEGLAIQADRLISSPRFSDGLRAFFSDFLQLDDLDTLSKDALIFPAFSSSVASALKEQTLRTIDDALVGRSGDYRDIFTIRRIAMTRILGPIYAIPVPSNGWSFHEFPEGDPRTGLLTQASILALHAHPGRTSPTLRGKAIREALLCEEIPSPPANVNFAVVQDVNNMTLLTTRARLTAHLDDEVCASCHKATDGIGLGLEQFDGAGQFRMAERGVPIDASGLFDRVHFADARELGRLFHDSPQVPACAVQTAWRYAAGRPLTSADEVVLVKLEARFAQSGYRIAALMRAIALDDALYAARPITSPSLRSPSTNQTAGRRRTS